MPFPELSAPLPEDMLARRSILPVKPASVSLEGRIVRLEPLVIERDAETLHAFTNGSLITLGSRTYPTYDPELLVWRYMFAGPFASLSEFTAYLSALLAPANALPMTIFERETEQPIGIACFMSNAPADLKIELGSISYSPIAQGTGANTEATYLMLRHAFSLGYRRLEWKCNALNERSRRSALRMGFQFEGIQESHMIVKGRSRDTAWFRILDHEWEAARQQLETLLEKY